jgi:hypothetical protein
MRSYRYCKSRFCYPWFSNNAMGLRTAHTTCELQLDHLACCLLLKTVAYRLQAVADHNIIIKIVQQSVNQTWRFITFLISTWLSFAAHLLFFNNHLEDQIGTFMEHKEIILYWLPMSANVVFDVAVRSLGPKLYMSQGISPLGSPS